MDGTDLQRACMADLGRQRQDELPLSGKEGKRPSYEPGHRNGTGHYAPALKKGLESKWRVAIQDEESAEMEGLAIGDSRPWATITENYMSRHHADTAPPLIRRESQGRKRLKSTKSCANLTVGKLGGLVPPHEIKVRPCNMAEQPRNTPKCAPKTKPETDAETKTENKPEGRLERVPESAPMTTTLPMRPKPVISEQVVYNGLCKFLDAENMKPLFVVTCALKIQKHSDKALLVLSAADREDRSHNVLDLSAPDIQGECCRLCSRGMVSGRFRHVLQFPNASDAKKFGVYLESLQKAAARALGASNAGKQSRKTEIPPSFKLPSHSTEAVVTQKTGEKVPKLVDVDSPSTDSAQEKKVPTIEDAAQMLFDLIERILPEAAAAGLNVSDDAISDIQETAIESWLQRGFLKSETDDMKSELLELLRILVRIKRKAESRKKAAPSKPAVVIESLMDFENADAKPQRIKYSVSEIQKLSSSSVAAPADLDKTIVTTRHIHPAAARHPLAAVADMSKHRAWLNGESVPQRPDASITTASVSDGKPGAVKEACPVAPSAADKGGVSPGPSPSAMKGLSTSRWARD